MHLFQPQNKNPNSRAWASDRSFGVMQRISDVCNSWANRNKHGKFELIGTTDGPVPPVKLGSVVTFPLQSPVSSKFCYGGLPYEYLAHFSKVNKPQNIYWDVKVTLIVSLNRNI